MGQLWRDVLREVGELAQVCPRVGERLRVRLGHLALADIV